MMPIGNNDDREKTVDAIYKLMASEDFDESYKKCMEEVENTIGELPEDVKSVAHAFFLKGYRVAEANNLEILTLIHKLGDRKD